MRPTRLYSVYAAIVLFGSFLASRVLLNWIDSRLDEQMQKRAPAAFDFLVAAARWGAVNPISYLAYVLVIGFLVVSVLLFVRHLSLRPMITIDGVDSYLSKHVTPDGRCYVVAPDVTITNHRPDRLVSIGTTFVLTETVEMAATNATNGPTEIVRHELKCQPETIAPDLTQLSSGAHFTPKKALEFPLQLGPGEAQRGYIAFQVWNKSRHTNVPPSRDAGTLVFTDYGTRKTIRSFPKDAHYLLGTYGVGHLNVGPPNIRISVHEGDRCLLIVRNSGAAFDLVARARIHRSSEPIQFTGLYEFNPREIAGAEGISSYTLATLALRPTPLGFSWVIKIHGELMDAVQRWEGAGPFACELEWHFYQKAQSQMIPLGTDLIRLSLRGDRRSLEAEVLHSVRTADGPLPRL